MTINKVFLLTLVLLGSTYNNLVHADIFGPPTSQELNILPPYCKAKQSGKGWPEWRARIGKNFDDIHHYCAAQAYMMRADKYVSDRKYFYQIAGNNLDYMVTHAKPGFILLPEILVKRGKLLIRQNQASRATRDFFRAIKLLPTYSPAYAALSDYYKKLNDITMARKYIMQGLEKKPGSKMLKRRLKKLDALPSANTSGSSSADSPNSANNTSHAKESDGSGSAGSSNSSNSTDDSSKKD